MSAYSIRWTGRILKPMAADLSKLSGLGTACYSPLLFDKKLGVYYPPGLWYTMVPGPNRPWYWHLPPPHHPMEAVAAMRGWGGIEGQNPQPNTTEWAGSRQGSWLTYVDKLGAYLFLRPAEARLLWHVLTPMRTNGGEPVNWRGHSMLWRKRLYEAAGLPNSFASALNAQFEVDNANFYVPSRMQFWGTEIIGEVEL